MLKDLISSQTRFKLLSHLLLNPTPQKDYARSLAKCLKISYMPVQKELRALERQKILSSHLMGTSVIYQISPDYFLYAELKALFAKDKERSQKIFADKNMPKNIKEVIGFLKAELEPKTKIFLFGSRAQGLAKKNSDWDIGFETKKKIPLRDLLRLKRKTRDLAWPYRLDVVDFHRVTLDFRKFARQRTVLL